jgi:Fe-S-cluster containining protein
MLRPGLVKSKARRRMGECIRCGACCKLIFKCPALYYLPDGTAGCRYHQIKPRMCRVFPIDERDLADRDLVMPERACGYYFKVLEESQEAREAGS